MSFAFWRRCDFQIHTPRDPNWTGTRPVGKGELIEQTDEIATVQHVDAARAQWANEFIDRCISKGLEAIALTDHHEMVMVPYVQEVIQQRKDADPDFDLWLFPAMELTAHGGVQCLILFDVGLSEDWRKQAQGKLGIVYADLDEKSAKSPKVTQLTYNYADIGSELDKLEGLRGHYIILPNVSQGNQHTVLTDGAHADFHRMSYVGGYLDHGQTIDSLSSKNKRRLSGDDKKWSTRKIYPLPTSDNRSSNYSALSANNVWIKLAAPTAEAIRQAFLGHQSRITIQQPEIASLAIESVEITGSTILEPIDLPISPELNSVIGGRGSGKSSFLEYVSFCLGRSCYDVPRDQYSGTKRMHDLVNDTLVSKGASVKLRVAQDNAIFTVTREPGSTYQPQIIYPNGSTQTITVKELRSLFPAVVYSQGELSELGKQTGKRTQLADLLQFVNPEFKRKADQLSLDIEAAKNETKNAIRCLTDNWILQAKLRKLTTKRDSIRQRITALEKTLPTLSEDDQATVAFFDKASEFEAKRLQASRHADQIVQDLASLATELLNERDLTTAPLDEDEAMAVQQRYGDLFRSFNQGVSQLQKNIKYKRSQLAEAEAIWDTKFKKARAERDSVLEKLGEHKTVTGQIIKLREEVTEITNEIGDLESRMKAVGDPSADLNEKLSRLRNENDQRVNQTQEWAREIENLSSGKIKAIVNSSGDISEIKDTIDFVAAKTGSQESTRLKEIGEALASNSVSDVLDRLRSDCLSLLYWRQMGAAMGEEQPKCDDLMKIIGDTDRIRSSITELMDTSRVEAISTALPKPEIMLYYCDGNREISFEKASEGQRAAALLFMLLEQPGGPLIIDQPEGDLDNKIISELTDKIHSAKKKRQLIFASHNANIVVNGSSELVGYLEVKENGVRRFECAGAIDEPSICKHITETMEGGEKAFKDRYDKYGY